MFVKKVSASVELQAVEFAAESEVELPLDSASPDVLRGPALPGSVETLPCAERRARRSEAIHGALRNTIKVTRQRVVKELLGGRVVDDEIIANFAVVTTVRVPHMQARNILMALRVAMTVVSRPLKSEPTRTVLIMAAKRRWMKTRKPNLFNT